MTNDFPIENLPYGIFDAGGGARIGVAIEDEIFDVPAAFEAGLLEDVLSREIACAKNLNPLLGAGRHVWTALRTRLTELLSQKQREVFLVPQRAARMLLPFESRDYVDFYSSIEHATNMGKMMRPNSDPLLPNWRWLPIGYHGRASTIVVDGTPLVRPCGQIKEGEAYPVFGPTKMLDVELELGFVAGPPNDLGVPISIQNVREHIFGFVLVNDWSARDIQAFEYQPLGPFNGKSFTTSISPWVVTLDALEPYRVAGPPQSPAPLPHLQVRETWNFDIQLAIELVTQKMREQNITPVTIARTNYRYMYWNVAQQLAHATSNGAAIAVGDLFASGTISGPDPGSYGSLMELTWRGRDPVHLPTGEERTFLRDGDTVVLRGFCESPGKPRIGFGSVSGTIVPAPKVTA